MNTRLREETKTSGSLAIAPFSRDETALAALPLFMLDYGHKRSVYELRYETRLSGPGLDALLVWQVSADPLYGYPDAFDRRVFKFIEYLAAQCDRPIKNPVRFSLRRVLDLLGLAPFPSHFARVRSSIRRISALNIQSQMQFESGERTGKTIHTFHLYNTVSSRDAAANGEIQQDEQWIAFSAWYLQNLNQNLYPSFDPVYFREIRNPIANRLYELLTVKFRQVFQEQLSGWRVAFSSLCKILPIEPSGSPQNQMETAHDPLISTGFLSHAAWEEIEKNWMILYVPGPRARAMYEALQEEERYPSRARLAGPASVSGTDDVTTAPKTIAASKRPTGVTGDAPYSSSHSETEYLTYWGLSDHPFDSGGDTAYFFETSQYKTALFKLDQTIHTRTGFMALSGACGCGKTFLIRKFLQSLDPDLYEVAFLPGPPTNPSALLSEILYQFGEHADTTDRDVLTRRIESFCRIIHQTGRRCALVIDEAQTIRDPATLEELRLLLNTQVENTALISLILAGQPELFRRLRKYPSLNQRMVFRHHLKELTFLETQKYIERRMRVAGAGRPVFSEDATRTIHTLSSGVPRRINTLCHTSLINGWASHARQIDASLIDEEAGEETS
jgi:type II secretory pathway predicted ATPase ExeA